MAFRTRLSTEPHTLVPRANRIPDWVEESARAPCPCLRGGPATRLLLRFFKRPHTCRTKSPSQTCARKTTKPKRFVQVKEAAKAALEDVAQVVRNPEIASLTSVLIDALTNPVEQTGPALTSLTETSFVHAIDSPSLALIVPILQRGLRAKKTEASWLWWWWWWRRRELW